jgi:hypothetical protein
MVKIQTLFAPVVHPKLNSGKETVANEESESYHPELK